MRIKLKHIKKFIKEEKFVISNHARVRMFQRNIEEYVDDVPCPSALILGFR